MSLLPEITETELGSLKGRTIVVTGGASGIGKAAILIAHGGQFLPIPRDHWC